MPWWATHLLIGWGDRGFFLEARTLADVRVTTALRALTYLRSSAIGVRTALYAVFAGGVMRHL